MLISFYVLKKEFENEFYTLQIVTIEHQMITRLAMMKILKVNT